jgi:2-(1,2-epoxy-1,2-dihydrophenyl)acetyl-CoA isomerase
VSTYEPTDHLRVSLESGVLGITFDKPDKRNALDDDMIGHLVRVLDAAQQDEDVRVVVFTGAGDHFCSGFDIVARNAPTDQKPRVGSVQRRLHVTAHRLVPLIASIQVPVVSVVRGWCAGIGLHVAVASDFAVAADDARFWEPFSERGFTPDSGGTWLIPRRVGDARARELLMLGRVLSGAEAADWGLIHGSAPLDALGPAAAEVVDGLAAGPTVALGLTKWLINEGASESLEGHVRNEAFAMELSSRSEDFREGLKAFMDKRKPGFSGR